MKKNYLTSIILSFVLVIALVLAGCSTDAGGGSGSSGSSGGGNDDGTTVTAEITVTQGNISFSSKGTAFDFGSLDITTGTSTKEFVIKNSSTADLDIDTIEFKAGASSAFNLINQNPLPETLPPGEDKNFSVIFNPETAGVHTGVVEISVTTASGDEQLFSLNITGAGIDGAVLTIDTANCNNGIESSVYSTTLAAAGGSGVFTWSIQNGSLPAGVSLNTVTGDISGIPTAPGTFNFVIKCEDADDSLNYAVKEFSFIIYGIIEITTTTITEGITGTAYSFSPAVTGGSGNYSWSVSEGSLPSGLSLNGTNGQITGTPDAAGDFTFTVTCEDSGDAANHDIVVYTVHVYDPVVINTLGCAVGNVGTVYSQTISVSGGSGSYAWSISEGALPGGLTLTNGVISGTPVLAGTYDFTISCEDSGNSANSADQELSIFVNGPVAITSIGAVDGITGTAYSQSSTVVGGSGGYAWSVTGGDLPSGLDINGTTGQISGTPDTAGTYTFTLTCVDTADITNSDSASSIIRIYDPLDITTTSLAGGITGTLYYEALAVSGGTGSYNWSVTSGTLPEGTVLNASTGVLTGTLSSAGSYSFTLSCEDSADSSNSDTFSTTVEIVDPVGISTAGLTSGDLGAAYSQTLSATGGSGNYSWSVTAGNLPDGTQLNASTGVLSGTPNTSGIYTFTIECADSGNSSNKTEREFSIIIKSVSITTAALPSTGANKSLNVTLEAVGGIETLTWSLESGSLPLDVTLSPAGVLSGYPSKPGTYTFTVRCEDSVYTDDFDTRELTLTVTNLEYTILIYLDADNDLETAGFSDLNEMEGVNLAGSGVKVIVLMDGIAGEYTGTGSFTDTRLYEIQYDPSGTAVTTGIKSRRLSGTELGITSTGSHELNMGDYRTVSSFIDFGKNNYTADNYAFIFWNHGDGWRSNPSSGNRMEDISGVKLTKTNGLSGMFDDLTPRVEANVEINKGVCNDSTSNDVLYTHEIEDGIAGKGISVVGFDACLMGMLEVAYEIRNSADYMVASEELVPNDGLEYNVWLTSFIASSKTSLDLVNAIVDSFETRYGTTQLTALAGINLNEIDTVYTAFNAFAAELYSDCADTTVRSTVRNIFWNDVDYFCVTKQFPGDNNIDIYDMAYEIYNQTDLADAEAQTLMTAIDNAVVASWHSPEYQFARGLAVYFITLNQDGAPYGVHPAYWGDNTEGHYLSFVTSNTNQWVPNGSTNDGLVYRLWYEQ